MSPARQGTLIALVILLADQLSKLWLLFVYQIEFNGDLRLAPFATITLVWNRGISYGLFQQEADWGRWGLVMVSFVAAAAFGVWLRKNPPRLVAWALGLGGFSAAVFVVAWFVACIVTGERGRR